MQDDAEAVRLLTEIRDLLREGAARQAETLEFVRANAERAKATADRSVALQEVAVKRAKSVIMLVIPVIIACLLALAYVMFGTRWR